MLVDKSLYWMSRPIADTYTAAMLQMDIKHHQDIPRGAKIIAAYHPSTTDPFFVAAMLPEQTFILINNLLFKVPVLGKYLRHSGHIPVIAGQGQQAIDVALDHLSAGHTIIIFPEGDLSPMDGSRIKPRTGVARLAISSGAPVIPVGIHLEEARMKTVCSNATGVPEYGRLYLSGPYAMTFGNPLRFPGDVNNHAYVRSVADMIMHHIIELSSQSKNRLDNTPGFLSTVFNF